MNDFWNSLERQARIGLLAGSVAIVLALAAGAWWLLRVEQAVLFADLKPQDAAVMAAELDRLKIPYQVADGGATLKVDAAQVHATRLKLMGRDLPLHGAVGLELFNNADFGMTEFTQKINYQRALQGELTRTILSFPEVRDARVHLALPDQGLFRQASSRPKAAVTLTLRQDQALRPEQVQGIRRLVAAAVPGLLAQEVTVVDQQGVALSRASDGEGAAAASARLDLKRETEEDLARKAGAVLDRAFGPGQALATVDVTLDMDQVRITTEDVIAAPGAPGRAAAGVLVRERESSRDTPVAGPGETLASRSASTQRDAEYQAGRRVEQVVGQPGSIRRLQVVAVVRQPLDEAQRERVRSLVAVAVGASPERGDTVLVQSFPPAAAAAGAQAPADRLAQAAAAARDTASPALNPGGQVVGLLALALALVVAVGAAWAWSARRRAAASPALTDGQRQLALQRVQAWLAQADAHPDAPAGVRPESPLSEPLP